MNDVAATFIPGLELSRLFYLEAVGPILERHFNGLQYAAARLDAGSDVLGFDTPRSMDHWWGPRVTLFLRTEDYTTEIAREIRRVMAEELPFEIHGFPTHMEVVDRSTGSVYMRPRRQRPINHMVYVSTAPSFFQEYLGINPFPAGLTPAQWLVMPEQHLRTIAYGSVWHDDTGEISHVKSLLRWYPTDLWRYVLKAQWRRIAQEEAFPGRCNEVGDELGSRVVTARLVREVMHLAFLLEREYMPYSKWLGTAFARLRCAAELQTLLSQALKADAWPEREHHLSQAYELVARLQNKLQLAEPVSERVSPYYGRPFNVIHGDDFAAALDRAITAEAVKRLPPYLGNTSQWVDSTDVLSYPDWCGPLARLYG